MKETNCNFSSTICIFCRFKYKIKEEDFQFCLRIKNRKNFTYAVDPWLKRLVYPSTAA